MEQLTTNFEPQLTVLTATGHPWRRYFARMADLALYSLFWAAIQYYVLRWWSPNGAFYSILIQYCVYTLMFVLEPLLLCTWGTTPGKYIMGLRPGSAVGSRLTYPEALKRTFLVFGKGMGYGIPIYNLVRMFKCRRITLGNELLAWEESASYRLVDLRMFRGWCIAAANAVCIALSVMICLSASLPLNRGELTPAQYAANCNELFLRGAKDNYYQMDESGQVKEEADLNALPLLPGPPPRHELTVENGSVTKVRLETSGDIFVVWSMRFQAQVAYLSFVGAQKGARAGQLSKMAQLYSDDMQSSFEAFDYGVHVRNEVTELSENEMKIVFTLEKQ